MMKYNINNYLRVKLTKLGKSELRKQWDDLNKMAPHMGEYKEPTEDEQGFSEFQGWVLMKKFGHLMGAGLEEPFETEIEIPESES